MLPENDRQLLTAYVDGELSSRQRRYAVRLLKRSPAARELLRQLQQDAAALRAALARTPKLGDDLSAPVLRTIRERRLTPGRRTLKPTPAAFPAWIAVAVAASILCVIGLASYMSFATLFAPPAPATPNHGPIAKKIDIPAPKTDRPTPAPEKSVDVARHDTNNETKPGPLEFVGPPEPRDEPPTVVVMNPPAPVGPPEPGPQPMIKNPDTPILAPSERMVQLEIVDAGPKPVILKLRDLDQEPAARTRLLDELKKDAGFWLELPCDHGTRAFDRLRAVCKDQKVALLIDPLAQQQVKAKQGKSSYLLYVENVTPEELARFMQRLAAEDNKKPAGNKPPETRFDYLVLSRMTKRHSEMVGHLLGVDPSKAESPGAAPKPGSNSAEATALVLAFKPVQMKNSPEVKRFLEKRTPTKPGTVRAVILVRSI